MVDEKPGADIKAPTSARYEDCLTALKSFRKPKPVHPPVMPSQCMWRYRGAPENAPPGKLAGKVPFGGRDKGR
jgi:hypothetical protein